MTNLYKCAFDHIIFDDKYTVEEKIIVLEECINAGINVNSDILQLAVQKKYLPIVEFLIEHGAEINSNILCSGVLAGYEMLKYLFDNGAILNPDDDMILNTAIDSGDYLSVKLLIEMGINIKIDNGYALNSACIVGNFEIVELLLQSGAEINDNIVNSYSLADRIDLVKLLIKYGLDPSASSNKLIMNACAHRKFDIVKYLVNIGVDCTEPKNMIIQIAYRNGANLEFKRFLLENSAGVDGTIYEYNNGKKYNFSILEYAVLFSNLEDCKMLLEFGADINRCYNFISGADLFVNKNNNELDEIIKLFMDHGLDISNVFEKKLNY